MVWCNVIVISKMLWPQQHGRDAGGGTYHVLMQMAVHHALGMLPRWLAPPPLPTAAQPLTVRVSAGNHMVELNTPSPNTAGTWVSLSVHRRLWRTWQSFIGGTRTSLKPGS